MDTLTLAPDGATIGIEKGYPVPVAVTANGGLDTFEAEWIAPTREGGFLHPYFTRDEAEKVIDWIMREPFPGEHIAWDEDEQAYRLTITNTPYVFHYPVYWRDGIKLHGIGAGEYDWLSDPPTLAPSELHPDEWAAATARASQWITLQSLFDWRELDAGLDPGLVLARQGFHDRFEFPEGHPFWIELADYLGNEVTAEVARARATHGTE